MSPTRPGLAWIRDGIVIRLSRPAGSHHGGGAAPQVRRCGRWPQPAALGTLDRQFWLDL